MTMRCQPVILMHEPRTELSSALGCQRSNASHLIVLKFHKPPESALLLWQKPPGLWQEHPCHCSAEPLHAHTLHGEIVLADAGLGRTTSSAVIALPVSR